MLKLDVGSLGNERSARELERGRRETERLGLMSLEIAFGMMALM